jgi:hypothetical protein
MKFAITLLLATATLCLGQLSPLSPQYQAAFLKPAAGGGVTYLLDTGFEATGTESGWGSYGSPEWDYTSSPIAGSHSFRLNATGEGAYANFTSSPELYGKMRLRVNGSLATAYFLNLFDAADTAGNIILQVAITASGGLSMSEETSDKFTADNNIYVWWHYLKGTGANARCDVWWNSTDTRPANGTGKHAAWTNGVMTANAVSLSVAISASSDVVIDDFKLAAEDFQ